ncbi:chorismate synthase [Clostridium sardiniense]|uniref:Chorismate synthase n=1 Tax=Clostridium sardiniense TaxID=29369 RepID=A0ABS7L2Q0_CLOSR|nr:chorismate synthase [Clostridium sardiniense]MBY0757356.1 chorismate synthase [Clostridium sardiniense]MDQ0458528.1 chorismate synthase [Clostridium sardiniense]
MSGIWGNNLKISIFGESHGVGIGLTIDGIPSGFPIDLERINCEMERRAPGRNNLSTARKEGDKIEILSGLFEGKTTGTPLCGMIRNSDKRSKDYSKLKSLMRPGHADYTGNIRYDGFNDYRGGGHFSGRITAPLVFGGAICKQILESYGIKIVSHIKSIGSIEDESFNPVNVSDTLIEELPKMELPLINKALDNDIRNEILSAKSEGDSVGGIIECAIVNIDAGIGNPFFDSVESTLAHLLFSVPAVKGVEFGEGFNITKLRGSEANDEFYYDGDKVKTRSNNNGGILGGITSGMPVIFRVAIKPTASILKKQNTINIDEKRNEELNIEGRHDPCIVQRAVPVIESVAAIGILELLKGR